MNERKFLNQAQPQTLVLGTLLLYINAVFGLLFGVISTSLLLGLATIVGLAIGGYGIANEWKWAYPVAVAAAILQLVMLIAVFGAVTTSLVLRSEPARPIGRDLVRKKSERT